MRGIMIELISSPQCLGKVFYRNVSNVLCEVPLVPFAVPGEVDAITIWLIFGRLQDLHARCYGPLVVFINVLNESIDARSNTGGSFSIPVPDVSDHHHTAFYGDFCMCYIAVWHQEPKTL